MSNIVIGNLVGKKLVGALCLLLLAGCLCLWLSVKRPKHESLQEKFGITDSILNSLVEKRVSFEEMKSKYGPPFRAYGAREGRMVVFFEMAPQHSEFLPPWLGGSDFGLILRMG